MKKLILLALASFLAVASSRADVIFQDTFNYSNGPIEVTGTNVDGSTNWFNHSGLIDNFVNNHQLEVSSSTAYLGVTATRTGDIHRNFATTPGSPYTNAQQVLYASFVVTFTNLPMTNGAGSYFAHFYVNGTTFNGKLWGTQGNAGAAAPANFTGLPNTFRLGVSAAGTSSTFVNQVYPVDLALNTPYQVVLGFNPTADASSDGNLPYSDTITLWINPISPSDPSVVSSDSYTPGANIATAFAFRQAGNFGGFVDVSNLVVSTTFPEALTNVLATNAVAPKIVYQPVVGVTNFVGSSVILSAVANGQGQGSLTYQWFQGSNPVGANANVLTIDNGSAQTTDSGNYRLIVTTPYGLSVTSSVSTVLISSAPVPPSFLTQPVSQTVYTGQTVILSTTVSSPGNVSYQWYSNNVFIAGANSSTYELDNIIINYSASYKVAVTNDVAVNGVVSTNAVLTVVNPPAVSIAYLRTLVDPTTYQATNSTLPFQITGTVTTLTNITSGNTSSYYLQDGTAGINIFATFGSTFRPAQGDVVTFVGVLSSFTSGLELYANPTALPYTSYTDTGNTAALPTPITIPFTITNNNLGNVSYTIAESLVKLTNVFFGALAGSSISNAANQNVTVTNVSGQKFVLSFFDLDLDTAGQTLPVFASSVTGVMYGNVTNYSVAVTKFSDIVTNAVAPSPIPLNSSYSGGIFTLNWTDPSFSLQAATNVVGPYTTITGAGSGFTTNTASAPDMFFRLYHP